MQSSYRKTPVCAKPREMFRVIGGEFQSTWNNYYFIKLQSHCCVSKSSPDSVHLLPNRALLLSQSNSCSVRTLMCFKNPFLNTCNDSRMYSRTCTLWAIDNISAKLEYCINWSACSLRTTRYTNLLDIPFKISLIEYLFIL